MHKKKVFILIFSLLWGSRLLASVDSKSDTTLVFSFPELPQTLYFKVKAEFPVTMASVYLPVDFNAAKKYPLILWIDGGTGGAGDLAKYGPEKFGNKEFIIVNLPLFKDSLESLKSDSSNYWNRLFITDHDSKANWSAYKPMLDRVLTTVPNVDHRNTFMGGFSNGGHVTATILNNYGKELKHYFTNFFFVEGGVGLKESKTLNKTPILFLKGGKGKDWTKPGWEAAQKSKAKITVKYMENVGHDFPKEF